ncbi:MAG: twin-arginine translocase TatA/TatE family subunit [Dermatophilaceae bacterium]
MLGINGGEILLLILIAILVLGPNRMPEYAAKLARGIRQMRVMAEGAKGQLKEQLGPDYQDLNWRQYDPRQYDPRRIVRQALIEPIEEATAPLQDLRGSATGVVAGAAVASGRDLESQPVDPASYDPDRATPWDTDAT